jgi:ligand-binding sensor domain-containing protein/signal transduction histidine kinase
MIKQNSNILPLLSFYSHATRLRITFWVAVSFICAVQFFFTQSIVAQNTVEIRFEYLSLQQGLSQSSVITMLQDKKGFLWVGTADGLNRYDGYKFKQYRKNSIDTTSIGNNYINALAEDAQGIIWVGTRGGLYAFDWATEGFKKYPIATNIDANHILSLQIDAQQNIWVGTIIGMYKINHSDFKVEKKFPQNYASLTEPGYQLINTLSFDNKGEYLWLGTEYGLFRYDTKHDTYLQYLHKDTDLTSIADHRISALYPDEQGNMWVGTYGGMVCRWNKTTNDFLNLKPSSKIQPYGSSRVKAFAKTRKGTFWVGTQATGLFSLQNINGEFTFTNYTKNIEEQQSLTDNDVISLLEDNNGILWVGTFGGGLHKFDTKQILFNHYQYQKENSQDVTLGGVRSICEDMKGNVWIGSANQGLWKFSNKEHQFYRYTYADNTPNQITSNRINAVFEDHEGVIWVGTGEGGLLKRVTKNQTSEGKDEFVNFSKHIETLQSKKNEDLLPNETVYVITEDKNHNLWVGTRTGLLKIDPSRTTVTKYTSFFKDKAYQTGGSAVRAVFCDGNDKIWTGTFDNGIAVLDTKTETFSSFTYQDYCNNCLNYNAVSSIYIDAYNTVWIGTFGGGLNKFDLKTKKFSYITENEGLVNNVVYGILEDGAGNLWLSTNRGLTRYNILSQHILNYSLSDGLQSDEFNANAYHKGRTGVFYFGGINGLTSFKPDSLQSAVRWYPVVLTDFQLFNKSVKPSPNGVLQKSITEAKQINLTYKDYVFSLQFAAINLSTPHRVRYAYKLEGFDNEWIYTNADQRTATYSNIPAGTYTFIVKATNSDGAWMDKPASITIVVKPPFWNTTAFKIISIGVFCIFLLGIYQYRVRSLTKRQEELETEVRFRTAEITQQKEEILQQRDTISSQLGQLEDMFDKLQQSEKDLAELNASKDKFFSILAHDLKSPLNSLGGFSSLLANFADEMSKEEIKSIAKDLEKNLKNSTKYLENLLTWARSQMNSIEFKPEKLNLATKVETSCELLAQQAITKHINIVRQIDADFHVFADRNQLQTILTNLIANAIKFTPENGQVTITAKAESPTHLRIEVADTGVGMSTEVVDKIFKIDIKHSTKGTAGESGTGLGLLLCKEFVMKNGGEIGVTSQEDVGTTFYFTLPKAKIA